MRRHPQQPQHPQEPPQSPQHPPAGSPTTALLTAHVPCQQHQRPASRVCLHPHCHRRRVLCEECLAQAHAGHPSQPLQTVLQSVAALVPGEEQAARQMARLHLQKEQALRHLTGARLQLERWFCDAEQELLDSFCGLETRLRAEASWSQECSGRLLRVLLVPGEGEGEGSRRELEEVLERVMGQMMKMGVEAVMGGGGRKEMKKEGKKKEKKEGEEEQ